MKSLKVTDEGLKALDRLLADNPSALRLFMLLALRADEEQGAAFISHAELAELLGASTRSIQRWMDLLEKHELVRRVPAIGRAGAYGLNPDAAWPGAMSKTANATYLTGRWQPPRGWRSAARKPRTVV